MIFDSPEIQQLREKYSGQPDYLLPDILHLDRLDDYAAERETLERIIQSANPEQQRIWLSRLFDKTHTNYLGAWFEIMLYDWLRKIGRVTIELDDGEGRPDFLLETKNQQILIEATAISENKDWRDQDRKDAAVYWTLQQIQMPYGINIEKMDLVKQPNIEKLRSEVVNWLQTSPESQFSYHDPVGNHIVMQSKYIASLETLAPMGPARSFCVNSTPLKAPLKKKSKKYKQTIQAKGYAYIIAVLLEGPFYSAESAVEAWFGKTVPIYDLAEERLVQEKIDLSGLHYYKNRIQHHSVSGTLVFKPHWTDTQCGRSLQAWFIQNPYSLQKVNPDLFPIAARFIKVSEDAQSMQMGWRITETGDQQ